MSISLYSKLENIFDMQDNGKPKKDYSCIVNENCGKTHQLSVKANDFYVEHLQKDV